MTCVNQRLVSLFFTYVFITIWLIYLVNFVGDFSSLELHGGPLTMENSNKTILVLLCSVHLSGKHMLFFAAGNYVLSITATLGNTVILFALNKESSLHPPSKLLYRCLALTDLLVGTIFATSRRCLFYVNSNSRQLLDRHLCVRCEHWCAHFYNSICSVHANNDCNKCGQTSRSVVGIEIQARRNFEARSSVSSLFLDSQHCIHCDHVEEI